MTIIGSTNKSSLLERTEAVKSTIILNVSSETILTDVELTRDLGICTLSELISEVYVNEIVP